MFRSIGSRASDHAWNGPKTIKYVVFSKETKLFQCHGHNTTDFVARLLSGASYKTNKSTVVVSMSVCPCDDDERTSGLAAEQRWPLSQRFISTWSDRRSAITQETETPAWIIAIYDSDRPHPGTFGTPPRQFLLVWRWKHIFTCLLTRPHLHAAS